MGLSHNGAVFKKYLDTFQWLLKSIFAQLYLTTSNRRSNSMWICCSTLSVQARERPTSLFKRVSGWPESTHRKINWAHNYLHSCTRLKTLNKKKLRDVCVKFAPIWSHMGQEHHAHSVGGIILIWLCFSVNSAGTLLIIEKKHEWSDIRGEFNLICQEMEIEGKINVTTRHWPSQNNSKLISKKSTCMVYLTISIPLKIYGVFFKLQEQKRDSGNLEELKMFCSEQWNKIEPQCCKTAITFYCRRFQSCNKWPVLLAYGLYVFPFSFISSFICANAHWNTILCTYWVQTQRHHLGQTYSTSGLWTRSGPFDICYGLQDCQ